MQKNKYSQEIADAISSALKANDWYYTFDEEKGKFKLGISLKSKIRKLNFTIYVKNDGFTVHALPMIGAEPSDTKMMQSMAEFICRANYGLKMGNFDFDFRDGEISYRIYVGCDDGYVPSSDTILVSLYTVTYMFKSYGNGIVDIIFNDANAKDAIKKAEEAIMADDDDDDDDDE